MRRPNTALSHATLVGFCTGPAIRVLRGAYEVDAELETRLLRVARTIADLDNREAIVLDDVREAMDYQTIF